MNVEDAKIIIDILEPLALAAATPALIAVSGMILRLVHLQKTSARMAFVETVLMDAAHGVYLYLVTRRKSVTDPVAFAEALRDAASHVDGRLPPGALEEQGMTRDDLIEIISRRFGGVLAADPTVTVTPPGTAMPSATVTSIDSIPRPAPRKQ